MKIHQIKGYIQSLYLVEYPDSLLLLDSGCYCDFPIVEDFITNNLKREFSDLKLVLISHTHPDHAGGAWRFKRAGINIAFKERMDHWYLGRRGFKNYWIDILLTWYVAKKMKRPFKNIFFKRRIDADFFLNDGTSVPGFPEWLCLDAPGHTDSDMTFYHRESSTAYVGDNIIKLRNKYIIPHPVSFPKLYRNSLEMYLNQGIQKFLLAHGGETCISKEELGDLINRVPNTAIDNSDILRQLIGNFKKNLKKSSR